MPPETVLVTGGAGYIGSHVAARLRDAGERVVILDNLSTGVAEAALGAPLVVGDVGDAALVRHVLAEFKVGTVMHFAARTIVPESVEDPLLYYGNNTAASRTLLEECHRAGIGQLVFSSTAAVYGLPGDGLARECAPTAPINPYGRSKLMTEWMLRDLAASSTLRYVALRYFNVAGCDVQGRLGQNTPNATLLVKVAAEVAAGRRPHLMIYGTDYPTADGTGVRDYIHVDDLAQAHLDALAYLRAGGACTTLNCGYGHGYSVREVIEAMSRAHGGPLPVRETTRRPGDPAVLVADCARIRSELGWSPRFDDLDLIARSSLAWETRQSASHAA